MRLLLDTQCFLWFVMGDMRLPRRLRELIESPETKSFLSIASLWELAIKDSKGKLRIDMSFGDLIKFHVLGSGFTILPVSIDHLLELRHLPSHHLDPFDHIIIAQGIAEDMTIVTSNSEFRHYPVKIA